MIVGIARAECFSPNSVDKDRAILEAVVRHLHGTVIIKEEELRGDILDADIYINMARQPQTMELLKQKERNGALVVNSAYGVESCQRTKLEHVMSMEGISIPPREGCDGYWIKRGDAAAQTKDDVLYCRDEGELSMAEKQFELRGITDYVVSAHILGDLVKFYGVEGTGFFRVFYPGDDGISKFGDETRNGKPWYYAYDRERLQRETSRLARLVQVPVYGGDAIITHDGTFYIIDFNDWPSFSRCREEAAEAIASLLTKKINNGKS